MVLTGKKFSSIHGLTGDAKNDIKAKFDEGHQAMAVTEVESHPALAALVYQIGQLEEEIDYLRTEISTNKDKATFPGLGTSSSTALAGDTTTISSSQASAITANTAKIGITTQQASAITANEKAVSNNASAITTNTKDISNLLPEVAAAIKVGAYPSLGLLAPAGTTQSHTSEIVYDTLQKKYFLNISYVETQPSKGGKGKRIIRTGQIELK